MPGRCPAADGEASLAFALLLAPHTNNNPSRFSDPSGHLGKDNVVCTDDGYCGTDKPTYKKPAKPIQYKTAKNKANGDFFSDAAYFFDNVGAIVSDINMVVTDVTMAVIVGVGCATGAGCLPAIGDAIVMDLAMTTSTPLGIFENVSGVLAAGFTVAGDFVVNKTSYITVDERGISIGIGRDSVMSVGTALAGVTPEANIDAWISNLQLSYDNDRRSGKIPASTLVKFTVPWSSFILPWSSLWGKASR